jgi:hypothetical protein
MDPDHHHHHMGPHHHTFDLPPMKYPFPKMDVIEKKTMDSPEDSEDSLNSMNSLDKEDSLNSEDSSDDSAPKFSIKVTRAALLCIHHTQ